jgi:hypothetical protein
MRTLLNPVKLCSQSRKTLCHRLAAKSTSAKAAAVVVIIPRPLS